MTTKSKVPDLDWTVRLVGGADNLRYRVTTKQWQAILLAERDSPIVRGNIRKVVAKSLGAGVHELRLAPMSEPSP